MSSIYANGTFPLCPLFSAIIQSASMPGKLYTFMTWNGKHKSAMLSRLILVWVSTIIHYVSFHLHNTRMQPQNWLEIWKVAYLSISTELCHKICMLGSQNGPLTNKKVIIIMLILKFCSNLTTEGSYALQACLCTILLCVGQHIYTIRYRRSLGKILYRKPNSSKD